VHRPEGSLQRSIERLAISIEAAALLVFACSAVFTEDQEAR